MFVKKSPMNAGTLDDTATRTIVDLNISIIADVPDAIRRRSAELKQQLDLIVGVTEQAKTNAKKLRLDGVTKVLGNAKLALKGLQEANNAPGSPDAAMTKKIGAIGKAIDELG